MTNTKAARALRRAATALAEAAQAMEADGATAPKTERQMKRRSPRRLTSASRKDEVYFIGGDEGPIKIGYSTWVARRLEEFQAVSPVPMRGRMVERVYGRMPRGALGPLVEARLAAVHPVYTTPENQGDQEDEGDAEMQEETVPRDRIELPTRGFSIHDEGPCLYAFRSDLVAIVHPVYTRLRKAVRSLQQSPDYAALAHAELAALRGGAS